MINLSFADLSDKSSEEKRQELSTIRCADVDNSAKAEMIADTLLSPSGLGRVVQGSTKHFYSDGAFNLVQLIIYILKQTGPAHVFLTSYSIAEDSVNVLRRKVEAGEILDIRFIIDNRVRTMSAKPFDVLVNSFPDCYRCRAIHAKVACIWNEQWKITVIGSQNATKNPKLERGVIFTDNEIFNYDLKVLNDEFNRSST